jgi:hypothetical protein
MGIAACGGFVIRGYTMIRNFIPHAARLFVAPDGRGSCRSTTRSLADEAAVGSIKGTLRLNLG